MRIKKVADDNVVISMQSFFLDCSSKDALETYFRNLFEKLEDYDLCESGFYQIEIYEDANYGSIFEIEGEEMPYFDYFDGQIEMSIHVVKNAMFLYQIDDIMNLEKEVLEHGTCYYYKNHFYIKLNEKISKISYMKLLEHSSFLYGKKAEGICKIGSLLDFAFCE